MITIYEMNYSLYNEIDVAASFPSYEKNPISSVTTTGTPEDDPMMDSVFKKFSDPTIKPTKTGENRHLRR